MIGFLKQNVNRKVWTLTVDYLLITIGLALYAFGWGFFLLPYKMVSGGVTGVAALVFYATGLQISYTYFVINFVLLIVALKVLGLRFMMKTIYAIFTLSLMLEIAQAAVTYPDGTMYQMLGPQEDFSVLFSPV